MDSMSATSDVREVFEGGNGNPGQTVLPEMTSELPEVPEVTENGCQNGGDGVLEVPDSDKLAKEFEKVKLELILVPAEWKAETNEQKLQTEIDTMKLSRSVWHHRTRIERSLFIFSLCAIIVIIALSITVGVWRNQWRNSHEDGICYNEECVSIAADLLTSINKNLDPCDDFYEFSCQQWMNRSSLVDEVTDRFSVLTTTLNEKLKELLDADIPDAPPHFVQARKFYKSCMDWGDREFEGVVEFITDLEKMGGWPMVLGDLWNATEFDYMETLGEMLGMGFDNGILFSIALTNDYKNTSFLRIMVHQTLLGLPDKDWFENDDAVELYKKTIQTYAVLIGQMINATDFGVTTETIARDASDAVDLERRISKLMYSKEYVSENNNTYNLMTIEQLDKLAPLNDNNSWLRLLNVYFPYNYNLTKQETVLVTVPKFIQKMTKIIRDLTKTEEGNRTLANYMFYRQVWEAAPYLNLAFKRTSYDFENYVTGKLDYPVQWEECLAQASAVFDFSMASIYIRKYFPPQKKEGIVQLVDRIKDELSVIINETSWMDNITQERAIEKLREITVMAVYPENVLNDTYCNWFFKSINVTDSYYDNMKNGNIFLYNLQMTGLREPVNKQEWKYLPSSILESNAYYTAQSNSIFIPLGVAHMWFFNEDGPAYANYGRIGFVLGHEISHAFDNMGSQLDGFGNWVDWWEQETKEKFNQAKTCLVKLFDDMTYSVPAKNISAQLNGTKTLGENIADDIGVQEAYEAYRKVKSMEIQQRLPGVDLTPNQLFWVNYASVWCEKDAESYYLNLIKTNEHPPSKYRVNSPLRNSPQFINDFNCKLGSNMNPTAKKCHVWGV